MEKQDLRIVKTHKALCDAFLSMLNEKRFENITVNELCERALVRRATFYKHFADKYDFFEFFIRKIHEDFDQQMGVNLEEMDIHGYTHFLFKRLFEFLNDNQAMVSNVINSSAFSTLIDILAQHIRQHSFLELKAQKEKGFEFSLPLDILSSFYAGGVIYLLRYWVTSSEKISEEVLIGYYEELERRLFGY